ncbi:MAG: organic solute transporter Ostalpha-domain-containing protein [Podila humilis]|nr:MAG: organic solute transporter Ostalpha-domain-containing protein [Podila humilis]
MGFLYSCRTLPYRVPIFAISSWVSLVSLNAAFYIDAFRDIYEAFVIYCFFGLLVYYLGGERSILTMLHGRPYTKHMFPVCLWSKNVDVGDPYTFLFIKRGILQYVYVKPVLAVVTMLLKANDAYNEGSLSLSSGYFWISFVYNLSVCLSLYCLGMFFMATQGDLEDFRPIPKFLCIKAVIFFSFWQGFAISVLVAAGVLRYTSAEDAVAIQDFLICFEMVFASLGHWYAFSHKDYTDISVCSARMPIYYAIRDACGIQDIIQDSLETLKGTRFTYRTFEPSEGVATIGKSRSGRIMAGLRYTDGGSSKYWLPVSQLVNDDDDEDGDESHKHGFNTRPMTETMRSQSSSSLLKHQALAPAADQDKAPSLHFVDLEDVADDEIEDLYDASKQLEYGDYNFPAIDIHSPHDKTSRAGIREFDRTNSHSEENGCMEELEFTRVEGRGRTPLAGEEDRTAVFGPSGWNREQMERDGCVDNVNGYYPERNSRHK